MSKKRIFVFGLDGTSWKLVNSFIKKGNLPFLKKIIRQSVCRDLLSAIPARTAPSWASFISGESPDQHGVLDFFIRDDVFGNDKRRLVDGSFLNGKEFWQRWIKERKKVALINLPLTYPVKKMKNGLVISFSLTSGVDNWFYPKSLAKLINRTGYKMEDIGFLERISTTGLKSFEIFRRIKKMADSKFQLAKRLIDKKDWDFFFMLFSETDWMQHLFWRGKQTLGLYQLIDNYLSYLYELLVKKYGARNFYFFVISDHGFYPAPKIYFNIYPWLRKNNFLPKTIKVYMASFLRKTFYWHEDKTKFPYSNWGDSEIIKVDNFGFWLNRKKIKDYPSFSKNLVEKLKGVKYTNGKKVFKTVSRFEDIYPGAKTKNAWDIVWCLNPYFYIGPCSIENKLFVPRKEGVKAIHDFDEKGILIAKGIGVKKYLLKLNTDKTYIWQMRQIFDQIFGLKKKSFIQKSNKVGKKNDFDQIILKRLKALGYA